LLSTRGCIPFFSTLRRRSISLSISQRSGLLDPLAIGPLPAGIRTEPGVPALGRERLTTGTLVLEERAMMSLPVEGVVDVLATLITAEGAGHAST
jgi:hypothetical protein